MENSLEKLKRHKKIWENKAILRTIYSEWYRRILGDLYAGSGRTIELGSGVGNFREFKPDIITSDVVQCPWLDMCFDAHALPFGNGSVANIVMIDVLHHLSSPVHFLEEAARALTKRGRIIILEPFPSLFSLPIYRRFHAEPFITDITDVDYFSRKEVEEKDPWDSNQAVSFLLFFKDRRKFDRYFGDRLKVIKRRRISCILYPASGGFENPSLIPDKLIWFSKFLEWLLTPFRLVMAFRCYVVLERQ